MKQAMHEEDQHRFAFKLGQVDSDRGGVLKQRGLMVDTGATSHIVTDEGKFKNFDESFKPRKHVLELADGLRASGIALKKGAASLAERQYGSRGRDDADGGAVRPILSPRHFLGQGSDIQGSHSRIQEGQNKLIHKNGKNGMTFDINVYDRLFYLNTTDEEDADVEKCHACFDIKTWHEILGHCNYKDVLKLQNVTEGMTIKDNLDTSNLSCEVCTKGKFAQSRSREPDTKAKVALELVHTDLSGPIDPVAKDRFRYTLAFTDDCSGAVFVYFLKSKSDTVKATEKFIADVSPYGKIKCIRSDNVQSILLVSFKHC